MVSSTTLIQTTLNRGKKNEHHYQDWCNSISDCSYGKCYKICFKYRERKMKTDFVWWVLGIAWMLIGLVQQIGGDHTQGLIDIAIGAEFLILAKVDGKKR